MERRTASHRLLRWSVAALVAVLALDAGRSFVAHLGWDAPASVWQPDRSDYADIAWPPAAAVPPAASRGERVYLETCAVCHGPQGRGNGAAAPSMSPRPRDLAGHAFKVKSTVAGAPPSRDDLRRVIADGLAASAMPGFSGFLSAQDIDAVLGHLVTLGTPVADDTTARVRVPPRPPVTADVIARGERVYAAEGCGGCHGADLRGGVPQRDASGREVAVRDLTAPWTFRGGAAPADVFLRLTTGMAPSPMPAYAHLADGDRWALVALLEARARIAPGEPGAVLAGPGQSADPLVRGRYLVRAGMCGLCHTEVSPGGIYRDEQYLAGGIRIGAHPQGVFVSRNLTPDDETGLGRWSEAEIARAIRDGRTEARLLNVWSMPWIFLHGLSDTDALAIARYLKTLPVVHNAVPQPLHYGTLETALAMLFGGDVWLGRPATITYASGSYANRAGLDLAGLQSGLVTLQVLVVAAWLALLATRIPRSMWLPLGRRSWRAVAGGTTVLAIYTTPLLGMLPADFLSREALREVPRPDTAKLTPERAALVDRGRYLFVNASCVFCHGPDGAGGLKISGPPGTLYTANISSDRDAGLGAWSDGEIARAIRSGVDRTGRPLYWQAMPWDHFSNLDEEDVMALVAYLRRLPPVAKRLPPYRPPAGEECAVYTAWTEPNTNPGCR